MSLLSAVPALAESAPPRADPRAAEPIAACKLQSIATPAQPRYTPLVETYVVQPSDDPLANYERTPLGDWPMPADAARDDPWLRVLLLAPKRPVVIDVAVFIDGEAFRDAREQWIDGILANGAAGNNLAVDDGTILALEASNEAAATDEVEPQADEPAAQAAVAAQVRQDPTMRDRLMRYLAAAGPEIDRQEVQWLIAQWGPGPGIIVLSASRSWQRAGLAPLLACLDQDGDGALSAAEIAQADDVLRRADLDGDDVVELRELIRVGKNRPRPAPRGSGYPLVVLLDANTDWDLLAANVARAYGGDSDLAAAEHLRGLAAQPADVTLRVDFSAASDSQTESHTATGATLLSVSPDLATGGDAVTATDDVIVLDVSGDHLEFAAAQQSAGETADVGASQLAIGAVIDGNPLLRMLDGDQDGRLTLRERRDLPGLLAALDRDGDGEIAAGEVPVPIRLAVTLGPHVHQLLATPTAAARFIAPLDAGKAPDWFTSMDKNRDGFLSRSEFLGTTEQFRQFDADGDELISAEEALKFTPAE